jgi:DNA-binding GntR family transcriptional regulator
MQRLIKDFKASNPSIKMAHSPDAGTETLLSHERSFKGPDIMAVQATLGSSRGSDGVGRLRALTYVDQVIDLIVSRAALGKILPGDRINELDLSRELGISRAPIREAFRSLVVQGVVESVAYQGVRLAPLSAVRVRQLNEVRFELEKLALRTLAEAQHVDGLIKSLADILEDMKAAARKEDVLALVTLDADFHEAAMRAAENPVLLRFWQMLRPQLIIMFGLAALRKPLRKIVDEHRHLFTQFETRRWKGIETTLSEHILADNLNIDFEAFERAAVSTKVKVKGKARALRAPPAKQ